jgi:hypothetical protein
VVAQNKKSDKSQRIIHYELQVKIGKI